MREIKKHIIHCSATPNKVDVRASKITSWHLENGWSDNGYHFIICIDGTIEYGRPCNKPGAHTLGHNQDSIGTCLIGTDQFTMEQFKSLKELDRMLKHVYNKDITTHGHNEFTKNKTCPNLDIQELFKFLDKSVK